MSDHDPEIRCKHCHSQTMRIVGCYVYNPVGAEYSSDFSFLDLPKEGVFETQKMLRCETCQKHATLAEALETASLTARALRWEKSVTGRDVPVICPICKNQTTFFQERLLLLEQTHQVVVSPEGPLELQELLTDDPQDTVTVRYRCAVEDCTGVIQINDNTFKVTPL